MPGGRGILHDLELVLMSPVWRFQTAGQEEEGGGDCPQEARGPPRAEAGEGRLVRALARRHTLRCLHYRQDRRGVEENASPWSGGPKERAQTHPHPAHVAQFAFVSQRVLENLEREDKERREAGERRAWGGAEKGT